MIKRIVTVCLCACLLVASLSGCGAREKEDSLTVVCTIFPIYAWAKQIVGEAQGVEVHLLVDNGTDLHSYQPNTEDIVRMISADLLLYMGGESDTWVEESLKNRQDDARVMLDLALADGVTRRQISAESIVNHEGEHTHGEAYEHAHEDEHDHGSIDEHLWLSLKNATACARAIADSLSALDPTQASLYEENLNRYTEQLSALDAEYEAMVVQAKEPMLLFADRFPFIYLAADYGINYVAAHAGCTTEVDATPATVIHLAEHLDEEGLRYVCVTESSDQALANSVIRATRAKDQRIAVLDSMQSVTQKQIEEGTTYLGIMRDNLAVLRTVLLP